MNHNPYSKEEDLNLRDPTFHPNTFEANLLAEQAI